MESQCYALTVGILGWRRLRDVDHGPGLTLIGKDCSKVTKMEVLSLSDP